MPTTPAPFLRLHPDDDVVIARTFTKPGTVFDDDTGAVISTERVDMGHKMAIRPLSEGQRVHKFGQVIGYASAEVQPGTWVHSHNLTAGELDQEYEYCTAVPPAPEPITGRTFMGYRRADGRAATRNYIGIISTVNCSATASKWIARAFDESLLADYPHIDGIVPLTHKGGCSFNYDGPDHRQLARTLAGFAKHANIGAFLLLGLGCEASQPDYIVDRHQLVQLETGSEMTNPKRPLTMSIQDFGGTKKTVDHAIGVLKEMLPEVNEVERVPIPASEIVLGLECGGSDGNSGVTANPAVGVAADRLVAMGGTAILAEVTEIYGGEQLLTRRAISREVGEKLIERIRWWENYTAALGAVINNNPSVGNKEGGLTTIYEKSLGAIAKGGSTALRAVYEYAEAVTEKGFVVMDTPGFDPASVTGMVAGGANVVVFTTGRGSCFGCKPVPTIKIATNTPMYNRMTDDMDLNAGRILDGASVEDVGEEIIDQVIAVAGGEQTKSEAQGIGDEEFCPWTWGPVL